MMVTRLERVSLTVVLLPVKVTGYNPGGFEVSPGSGRETSLTPVSASEPTGATS